MKIFHISSFIFFMKYIYFHRFFFHFFQKIFDLILLYKLRYLFIILHSLINSLFYYLLLNENILFLDIISFNILVIIVKLSVRISISFIVIVFDISFIISGKYFLIFYSKFFQFIFFRLYSFCVILLALIGLRFITISIER